MINEYVLLCVCVQMMCLNACDQVNIFRNPVCTWKKLFIFFLKEKINQSFQKLM